MTFSSLDTLLGRFRGLGAVRIVIKPLAENDNTKQQIYLGSSFEILKVLPFESVKATPGVKRPNFKAPMNLSWIDAQGHVAPAQGTKLILYPDYPEVRLSGFLRGCPIAPSRLMQPVPKAERQHNNGPDGRVLFLGIRPDGGVLAYVSASGSEVSRSFANLRANAAVVASGALWLLELVNTGNARDALLQKLREIHTAGWHPSMRLDRTGRKIPYAAQNGGGYTLEALFGISPNGRSEPDYMGWELKAFGSSRITLMTPEPDTGFYGQHGTEAFVRKYGRDIGGGTTYFTGLHRVGLICAASGQVLRLDGFDPTKEKVVDVSGGIQLVDRLGQVSAGWSFADLIDHWGRKHASAAYIPYEKKNDVLPEYFYGSPVLLGEKTTFPRYLKAMHDGHVVYDPGSKVTTEAGKSRVKARSQFRISVKQLACLYESLDRVDL